MVGGRWLKVLPQIHTAVQTGDVFGIAIEGQRLAPAEVADPPFACLTPAGVVDGWIDIGVKAVLARRRERPAGRRLSLREADLDNRLGALEAVLPGNDQSQGGAVLVGQ